MNDNTYNKNVVIDDTGMITKPSLGALTLEAWSLDTIGRIAHNGEINDLIEYELKCDDEMIEKFRDAITDDAYKIFEQGVLIGISFAKGGAV